MYEHGRRSATGPVSATGGNVKLASLAAGCSMENRARVDVDVYLLEMGQVKTVSTGKGSSPRRVLGLILADESLVIQCTLWSPSR